MTTEFFRLLDNGWHVEVFRQVDRKYCAAARRPGEKWQEIFATVNKQGNECGFPTDDFERANYSGPRRPERIASADTPEEAIRLLASKAFGGSP